MFETTNTNERRHLLAVPAKEGGLAAFWLDDVRLIEDVPAEQGCFIFLLMRDESTHAIRSEWSAEQVIQHLREVLS